jgi:hypothetical protein
MSTANVRLFVSRALALSLLLLACLGVSRAAAEDPLVLSSAGLPGWHAAPTSVASARSDLATTASRSLVGSATVRIAAARHGGMILRSEAFLFRNARSAARAVRAFGQASKSRRVSLGQGQDGRAAVRRLRHGTDEVIVVWREHARVGLLTLQAGRRDRGLSAQALDYARLADTLLRIPAPRDRWGRVLEGIRADGSVSKQTALQAFAVAYGGIPGVRVPDGRRVAVPDGTGVIAWMQRYARALTPRQRAVVDARLGLHLQTGLRDAVIADYGDGSFRPDPAATRVAYTFVPSYEALTGHHLSLPIVVGPSTDPPPPNAHGDAVMDAAPVNNPDGQSVCRVRLLPARRGETSAYLKHALAHEVFHCFQFDLAPTRWASDADWIIEGGADWAATVVDRVPGIEPSLDEYIQTPHRPLFARSYDAIGFWGYAADKSTEETIFANMGKILNAGSNVSAYADAGGFGTQFLTDWGPSVFRQTALPPEWTMRSPITPPDYFAMPPGGLGAISGHGNVSAAPYSTAQYLVETHADVVRVAISGHAKIYSGGLEYSDLSDAYFCTRQDCTCPPGTEGQLPPLRPLFDGDFLGITGDPSKGTTGSVTSLSLDDFCHPKPNPTPPPPAPGGGSPAGCASPCGSSNGDPHLETIAGYDYDFQAAGEFTAVKSTTDGLEIQERQEPFMSRDATVNTAVAMSVAGDRVEIDAGSELRLRVNGSTTTAPANLPHGGTVDSHSGIISVTWPDGSQAQLWSIGPWGVAYLFEPAPARAGRLVGLLGNDGGDTEHLVGRDGHVYLASALEGTRGFAAKYHRFGESWRITQATSLFTYSPGRSTASYTDRSIPPKLRTLGSLPTRVRAAAARTCRGRGIIRPAILRDCTLDLAITRQPAFASSAATLQDLARLPDRPPVPPAPTRATRFVATCDADAPADANGQIPVGTDAGIEIDLQSATDPDHDLQTDGQILVHWPEDGIIDSADSGTSDFHELDRPGIHTAYATFGGDADHDPAQSITCTWNVAG